MPRRAHVKASGYPSEGHGCFPPQAKRDLHLSGVAFASGLQIATIPPKRLELLRHNALGFSLSGIRNLGSSVPGTRLLPDMRQQLLAKFIAAFRNSAHGSYLNVFWSRDSGMGALGKSRKKTKKLLI
jgi:hypothetical protein